METRMSNREATLRRIEEIRRKREGLLPPEPQAIFLTQDGIKSVSGSGVVTRLDAPIADSADNEAENRQRYEEFVSRPRSPGNPNHPKKGSTIRVDPITDLKKIEAIKWLLRDKPRNYALFIVGINTNLRASDLTRITIGQVRGLKPMDEITLKEKKTGKQRRISLNAACVNAINRYLESDPELEDGEPIFNLTVPTLSRMVRSWCEAANCKGRFAGHSLRKSWAYHQHKTFGVPLPNIMVALNHSNQAQTLGYLSIQPEEMKAVYANEL